MDFIIEIKQDAAAVKMERLTGKEGGEQVEL